MDHPSTFTAHVSGSGLHFLATQQESKKLLSDHQLSVIKENNLFGLFVPGMYGGLGLSLPEGLRVEEALAWADGSVAWAVTLCAGAGWFIGFLQPTAIDLFFRDANVCLAGSGNLTGRASVVEGGYNICGSWKYATGAPHATAFTANCIIEKDGLELKLPDGSPMIRSFIFLREEVVVSPTWNSMGMLATGSDSFAVDDLFVPGDRCFRIDPAYATLPGRIYQYPFLQLAHTTLAINISGLAMRFLDLSKDYLEHKGEAIKAYSILLQSSLDEARNLFYEAAEESWQHCNAGKEIPGMLLSRVSEASLALASTARNITTELYPYCGLAAADVSSKINQVWRDINTAGQHAMLNPPRISL